MISFLPLRSRCPEDLTIYDLFQSHRNATELLVPVCRNVYLVWQDLSGVEPAVSPRYAEAAVEGEEQVAKVASTLARADKPWSPLTWIKLVKEEELYLYVNFPM
jgi:hypothetical protein